MQYALLFYNPQNAVESLPSPERDGFYAETKEILGGLFVIECSDLDEALGRAWRCPILRIGTVEVRPEFPLPR